MTSAKNPLARPQQAAPPTGNGSEPMRLTGKGAPEGTVREAARVLIFDRHGRVLLARGHDGDQPSRSWWFTIGGGIEGTETARQAAVREVAEETGIELAEEALVGPVLERRDRFEFFARTVDQHELFFLAFIEQSVSLTTKGWTAVERRFMDELHWWDPQDLSRCHEEVFPHELPRLARSWAGGWGGEMLVLDSRDENPADTQ